MWNALRADFQEFVTTVTEDTSTVLTKLDAGVSGDEEDANGTSMDAEENAEGEQPKREVNQAELREIMKLLRDHPGTYTEPLTDEDEKEAVEEYLQNFSIDAKTDEIAEVLNEHEETVKVQFEELCPTQVSYEDFWKRYFYRCDEDRIAKQLQEETERARQARAEAIDEGIKSVTNFFGGAVKAVTNTIAPEGEAGETQQGINLFGARGRPPFVMNTAVSESGDEDVQEEDDEEELGWDDDDDDDDDDLDFGTTDPEDTPSEQIEFTDKVSEDLQEKLKQALEERDQIQQTVQMQADEIKVLQGKISGNPDLVEEGSGGELEALKLKLFEKDAELAALKASSHDDHMEDGENKVASLTKELQKLPADQLAQLKTQVFGISESCNSDESKVSALEQEVQQLSKNLESKEAALVAANDSLTTASKELEATRAQLSSDQANAQSASSAMQNLAEKANSTQQSLEAAEAENAQLRQSAQAAEEASASQVAALKQELAAAQEKAATLTKQMEETTQELKQSEEALQKKATELVEATRGGTPDTVSTGVKVAAPVQATGTKLDLDGSEGDDWGDDWD